MQQLIEEARAVCAKRDQVSFYFCVAVYGDVLFICVGFAVGCVFYLCVCVCFFNWLLRCVAKRNPAFLVLFFLELFIVMIHAELVCMTLLGLVR